MQHSKGSAFYRVAGWPLASAWPLSAAQWSGVPPCSVRALVAAPRRRRRRHLLSFAPLLSFFPKSGAHRISTNLDTSYLMSNQQSCE